MTVCRGSFNVGERQSLWLEFDGERLDPDDQVQTTDIVDMECIDVHIT